MSISENINVVKQRIHQAAQRCGRSAEDIQLIAVTKTLPVAVLQDAYQCGLRHFGESRAQEFRDKIHVLPEDTVWHFIGHLQTNKIKYVIPSCVLMHSLDSMHLANAISEFCVKKDVTRSFLLEVKTSDEATKFGFDPDEAVESYITISEFSHIRLQGLMTIAPFVDDINQIRNSFRMLREIRDDIYKRIGRHQILELSMGMSQDYEIAIEEGSTMIRVGTSLFGPRGR
jgi:PLP dependent protein